MTIYASLSGRTVSSGAFYLRRIDHLGKEQPMSLDTVFFYDASLSRGEESVRGRFVVAAGPSMGRSSCDGVMIA